MVGLNLTKGKKQQKAILFVLGTIQYNTIILLIQAFFASRFSRHDLWKRLRWLQEYESLPEWMNWLTFENPDSENIFNNLPKLPDQEAEFEREKIINYCFPLDI